MKNKISVFIRILAIAAVCVAVAAVFSGCCLEHKYETEVTPPTCTDFGYTTYKCAKCGESKINDIMRAKGHSYEVSSIVEPTCTEDGYSLFKCGVCGDSYNGLVTPALGHEYASVVTIEPTGVKNGVRTFTCVRCGDEYTEEFAREKISAEEIYRIAKASVGEIHVFDYEGLFVSGGTGFAIEDGGVFLTNYHVMDGAVSATITVDGEEFEITDVLAFDARRDLAAIKADLKGKTIPALRLCREEQAGGATVYTVGSSQLLTLSMSSGVIAYPTRTLKGMNCIQIDAPLSSGNSGGPLFNAYGEVIGVNFYGFDVGNDLNLAININEYDALDKTHPLTMKAFAEKYGDFFDVRMGEISVDEKEPNNYLNAAQKLTRNGATVRGTIDGSGDYDIYSLTLEPGEEIRVILSMSDIGDVDGAFCAIRGEDGYLAPSSLTTFKGEIVRYAKYKNKTSERMNICVITAFSSNYKLDFTVAYYDLFVYKKATPADEYDYEDTAIGLKFKAPDKWMTDFDRIYGNFTAMDYESYNYVRISERDHLSMAADELIGNLAKQLANSCIKNGYTSVSVGETTTVRLGNVEFLRCGVTYYDDGDKVGMYLYIAPYGENYLQVVVRIVDGLTVAEVEEMFK